MSGRDGLDGRSQPLQVQPLQVQPLQVQPSQVNVLDYHANERVAKAVALVGSYFSWVMLGFLVALAALFGI